MAKPWVFSCIFHYRCTHDALHRMMDTNADVRMVLTATSSDANVLSSNATYQRVRDTINKTHNLKPYSYLPSELVNHI